MEFQHKDFVNLVVSTVPPIEDCPSLVRIGLLVFTGDQWNQSWGWIKSALDELTNEKLIELYNRYSE